MSSALMAWPSPRRRAQGVQRPERVEVGGEPADEVEDHLLDPFGVLGEHLQDAHRVDRLGALVDARVVVGDEGDVDDRHPELAAQPRLGVLGHVDDLPARVGEPLRFGLGREAGTLDHDDGAALVDLDAVVADGLDGELPQDRVVRLGRGEVGHDRPVVERVGPLSGGPIDELVADHEVTGLDRQRQGPGGTGRDHRLDAE